MNLQMMFQDQPSRSNNSKLGAQLLTNNLRYLLNFIRLCEIDEAWSARCQCSIPMVGPGVERVDKKYSMRGFYNDHKDCECLFFHMLVIAARKIGNYYSLYLDMPLSGIAYNQNEVELGEYPKLCLYHNYAADDYEYTSVLQSKFKYIYLTQPNEQYYKAMVDIMSCKFVAVIYKCGTTRNKWLVMMSITTSKATYVIDFITLQGSYLPTEIAKMLQTSKLAKIVDDECSFSEYFRETYKVEALNLVDIEMEDFKVKHDFGLDYLHTRGFNYPEEVAEKLDNNPSFEVSAHKEWLLRPVSEEEIVTTAKTCFYTYKLACCIRLTSMFMSKHFTDQINLIQNAMLRWFSILN